MAMNLETWIKELPPVTRYMLGTVVFLTVISQLGVVNVGQLLLTDAVITRLQLWRPFTAALFVGNFSPSWPFSVAIFAMYSNYNEKFDFNGKTGDYIWMWIFMITAATVVGLFVGLYLTSFSLVMSLCWLFCKRHPEMRMTLFSFEFSANTFPWVLLLFHLMMGGGLLGDVVGIAIGHLYFFLRDILPETHGLDLLRTPAWFLRLAVPNSEGRGPRVWNSGAYRPLRTGTGGSHSAGATAAGAAGTQHRWGQGQALGSN